jgi:hypothetical protein
MGDSFTVLRNNGDGVFEAWESHLVADRPQYINSFDFDGDGWPDILVSSSDSNSLTFFRNEEGAGFTWFTEQNIGAYPYAIEMADFNSDGRTDMVLTSVNTNSVIVTGCYYYPHGLKINIGKDSSIEVKHDGLVSPDVVLQLEMKNELNRYIKANRVEGEDLNIPLSIICQQEGMVRLSNLLVVYSLDG